LVNVCSAFVTKTQSAKAMKPTKGSFNNPTPATELFAWLDAVPRYTSGDTSSA
jgi:hypothetical protein